MTVSPYAFPGLKFNYLTEDQKKELFRTLPSYKLAEIIIDVVAKYFNISLEDMKSNSRKGILPWSRHLFCFLAKEITHLSDLELAFFIKRDRSTVSNHIKEVKENIITYIEYRDQVIDLRLRIKSAIVEYRYSVNNKTG